MKTYLLSEKTESKVPRKSKTKDKLSIIFQAIDSIKETVVTDNKQLLVEINKIKYSLYASNKRRLIALIKQ